MQSRLTETVLFLAVVATILTVIFLSGCAADDPERMRVQADGEKAMHAKHANFVRGVNRASAPSR